MNGTLRMIARLAMLARRPTPGLQTRLALSAIAAVVLVGCSGNMQGTVRGDGTPVRLSYEPGAFANILFVEIDRERFSGRAVPLDPASFWFVGPGSAYAAEGNVYAIMPGNRGSMLRCVMKSVEGIDYVTPGDSGQCFHSDGRVIDVVLQADS